MRREDLFFDLPQDRIAQEPVEPRDHCQLMILNREKRTIQHQRFFALPQLLKAGDVLVFNQSKVLPARLLARRGSGGSLEILLLRDLTAGVWSCLLGGRAKEGETVFCGQGLEAVILSKSDGGAAQIRFNRRGPALLEAIQAQGSMPTPPYIKKQLQDSSLYQTVFAKELGSAAAPTAGLHFTQPLLDTLTAMGVQQEFVTLHVGLGTFQPIKTERVEDHPIHSEWFSINRQTITRLQQAKREGRRIVAVGTTSVRVLETIFSGSAAQLPATPTPATDIITGETKIFIHPGYAFQAVDALITNFHTPYSSLLALVYAFAGQDFVRQAYAEAMKRSYRFFSFGDAMFIQ